MFEIDECKKTTVQNIFNRYNTQVLLVRIEEGGEVPPHSHEVPCSIQILRGSGIWFDGDKNHQIKKGDLYHKESGQVHGFSDIGHEGLEFISVSYGDGIVTPNGVDFVLAS